MKTIMNSTGIKPLGGKRSCKKCGKPDYMSVQDSTGCIHGPRYYQCFRCQRSMAADEYTINTPSRKHLGDDEGDLNYMIDAEAEDSATLPKEVTQELRNKGIL